MQRCVNRARRLRTLRALTDIDISSERHSQAFVRFRTSRLESRARKAEVLPRACEKLPVSGVIDGFDTYDLRVESRVVGAHVPKKLELCARRSHQENLGGALECARDIVEEAHQITGMIVFPGGAWWVTVNVSRRCRDRGHLLPGSCDLEDARFRTINPNERIGGSHES